MDFFSPGFCPNMDVKWSLWTTSHPNLDACSKFNVQRRTSTPVFNIHPRPHSPPQDQNMAHLEPAIPNDEATLFRALATRLHDDNMAFMCVLEKLQDEAGLLVTLPPRNSNFATNLNVEVYLQGSLELEDHPVIPHGETRSPLPGSAIGARRRPGRRPAKYVKLRLPPGIGIIQYLNDCLVALICVFSLSEFAFQTDYLDQLVVNSAFHAALFLLFFYTHVILAYHQLQRAEYDRAVLASLAA